MRGFFIIDVLNFINNRTIEITDELKSRVKEESISTLNDVYLVRDIIPENYAIDVVERLYGYKTNSELIEVIKKYYGSNSAIVFNHNSINVCCNLDNIGKHLSIDMNDSFIQMLKEIKKYSKNINKIDELNVLINFSIPKGLKKLEYCFDFNKQLYSGLQYYDNGNIVKRNKQLRI